MPECTTNGGPAQRNRIIRFVVALTLARRQRLNPAGIALAPLGRAHSGAPLATGCARCRGLARGYVRVALRAAGTRESGKFTVAERAHAT